MLGIDVICLEKGDFGGLFKMLRWKGICCNWGRIRKIVFKDWVNCFGKFCKWSSNGGIRFCFNE